MTVADMRARVSQEEFILWCGYYGLMAMRQELRKMEAESKSGTRRR